MHPRRPERTDAFQYKLDFSRQMRKNPTPAEAILWDHIKKKQLGVVFKRQAILQGWIVDNYCGTRRLCVEVDGPYHEERAEKDKWRDMILLNRFRIRTLRVTNDNVMFNLENVLNLIRHELYFGMTNSVLYK